MQCRKGVGHILKRLVRDNVIFISYLSKQAIFTLALLNSMLGSPSMNSSKGKDSAVESDITWGTLFSSVLRGSVSSVPHCSGVCFPTASLLTKLATCLKCNLFAIGSLLSC